VFELTLGPHTPTMPLMAQRIVTELTDDTDGRPADETVSFALDGREYEIDLTSKNAAALRKAFDVYVKNGRRIGGGRRGRTSGRASSSSSRSKSDVDTKAVREWAGKNGFELSARGRIPGNVIEAYQAAH
jgi:nucleoid-associated protein Lsr2